MRKTATRMQEKFAFNLFQGMSPSAAYIEAGYSKKSKPEVVAINACNLAKNNNVVLIINRLRQKAEDASVMSVLERRQRLSEIARAKITDFTDLGKDGTWTDITGQTKNSGAIAEMHSRTENDPHGNQTTIYTSVKLHDPQKAIDLLNKMDKIYSENNTTINILNITAKELTDDELASIASRGSQRVIEQKAGEN